ncbi:retron Ec48 family effector membrane protein [Shewanella algae]|uniref:retron Ec48 family effector membrane protein n=1 Tax=Shewanella algae TaxID=38313 RepID=UPI001F250751|nr:retron Ec48 family effector membrane protein [Shewanella algae]MCE9783088.1 retron Ec48 family effector membrane protein [Shewanella algae]
MTKLQSAINLTKDYKWYLLSLFPFVAILICASISIAYEFYVREELAWGPCISDNCLTVIENNFGKRITLIVESFKLSVLILAFVSAHIALVNYRLSLKNSKINNHISNFNSFCGFIDFELEKRSSLNKLSVNKHTLYNLIYPDSREGDLGKFDDYSIAIDDLKNSILKSSEYYTLAREKQESKKTKGFDHNRHQDRMIKSLSAFGISSSRLPKNDFLEVEQNWLFFIDAITDTFAPKQDITKVSYLIRTYA